MAKKKVFILGAGLAGLSAAWHLRRNGIDCRVFEKEPEAGGLCRSKKIGRFTFDYDGHLLHFKHRYTFDLIKNILKVKLNEHRKNSWIYSHKKYTRYPFQANLYGLPSAIIKECLTEFIKASNNGHLKSPSNFLDWINLTFGSGIAKHFMIPYNAKFWTVSPEEMSYDWLDGFIPIPSLNRIIDGTIQENKEPLGYNARFWYPKRGGIEQLAMSFINDVEHVHLNSEITAIDIANREITIASAAKERFDCLISTLPLPELPNLVKGLPQEVAEAFKKLRWNSIFNLNLGVNASDKSGKHWIYFPEKEIIFFRAGFYNNFSSDIAPRNATSLYAEVSYPKDKMINTKDITAQIKENLKKAGILNRRSEIVLEDANDIKYGYPICDINYNSARAEIIRYLSGNGIFTCGRYGSWRYMSMEDVILDGKIVAEKLYKNNELGGKI